MPSAQVAAAGAPPSIWHDPRFVQWRHDHIVVLHLRYDAPGGQFFSEEMPVRLTGVMVPQVFSARIHEINDHLATYPSYALADYSPNFNILYFLLCLFSCATYFVNSDPLWIAIFILCFPAVVFQYVMQKRKHAVNRFMEERMLEFSRLDKDQQITWSCFQFVRLKLVSVDWRKETVRVSWCISITVDGERLNNGQVEA
ncbi:hypothetical protein HDU98_004459 [Podochytrium sp. JEL0797]|nr:hypothetical protein HDU98_004459 [Podochytrium sp. JEL0797]